MADFFAKPLRSSTVIASIISEEADKFAPLPLKNVRVGQQVPFALYLKMKAKESPEPQLVRVSAPGDIFQAVWQEKLVKLKIQWLYFSLQDVDQVFDYQQSILEGFLNDDSCSEVDKARQVCDLTQVWVLRFFTSEESRTGQQITLALSLVDGLMESVKQVDYNSLMLLELKKQSFYIYAHSVSCCLLGLAFTQYLGWKADKARNFGLGALIHDIGYARLPRGLVMKKEGFSEDDISRIQRHPIEGFRMLQSYSHLPWEALQMVLRHHENGDCSGYPDGLKLSAIPTWARIMRIIDSYEELTSERPGHRPLSPKEALWTMRQHWEENKLYDHHYLLAFISFLAGRTPGAARKA